MTMPNRINNSADLYGTFVKQVSLTTESRGLSWTSLANKSGMTEERLSSILSDKPREVTLRELVGLSLALGVSLAALLAES